MTTLADLRRLAEAADRHIFDDATSVRLLSPELAEYVDAALPSRILALLAVADAAERFHASRNLPLGDVVGQGDRLERELGHALDRLHRELP